MLFFSIIQFVCRVVLTLHRVIKSKLFAVRFRLSLNDLRVSPGGRAGNYTGNYTLRTKGTHDWQSVALRPHLINSLPMAPWGTL